MTRATPNSSSASATNVPAESDLLCEGCGYTLNGLPVDGRCPECGKPIAESTDAGRAPTAWETSVGAAGLVAFFRTSLSALFAPTRFFRTTTTRGGLAAAQRFAWLHWLACSILLAGTVLMHRQIVMGVPAGEEPWHLLVACGAWVLLLLTTRYAARLTAWEAAYRGLRMPLPVVLRGMYYHAPHYLPVCAAAFATTIVTLLLVRTGNLGPQHITTYLYVLCAEVVLGAAYLFWTYWIAMRNMMFANK